MEQGAGLSGSVDRGRGPLLERERELESVAALLDSAATGDGRVVLLSGPAGIGKSSLLEAIAADAAERGFTVARSRGDEPGSELDWGAVRELFEHVVHDADPDRREQLLSGGAAMARPILAPDAPGSGAAIGGDGDAALGSALHGLYWLCVDVAERAPLALIVDDVQWTDVASRRFLAYLARRVDDLPVLLALAARDDGDDQDPTMAALADAAEVVRPQPLSADAVAVLLEAMLDQPAQADFAAACHRTSGGNPFLLHELARELRREGVEPRAENTARIEGLRPGTVRRAFLLRLLQLPEAARTVAEVVAVLGDDATPDIVAALAELDLAQASAAADALIAAQILAAAVPLRFAHPIVRGVMAEEISPLRRALLQRRAAAELIDRGREEEAARHLLGADPRADADVVAILRRQAGQALRRGAPGAAVAYLGRALREPPAPDQVGAVLIELADAEAAAGDVAAVGHLEQALELDPDPDDRAALLLRLGSLLCRVGRIVEGSDVLERALADADGLPAEMAQELEAAYLANAWQDSSRAADVRRRQAAFLARNGGAARGPARRALIAQSALGQLFAGDPVDGVVSLATQLLTDPDLLAVDGPDSLTPWTAIGCLSWADALDAAEEAIERTSAEARRRHSPVAVAWGFYARSWPRYWRGHVSEAAADAEAAIAGWRGAWEMFLPAAQYWLAMANLELDDVEAAAAALVLPDADRWVGTSAHPLWRAGLATVAMRRGEYERALADLLELGSEIDDQLLVVNPALLPWRSLAATAAAALGERAQGRELAARELEIARRFGSPRPIGIALRAAALAAGGDQGIALLGESVRTLERSPARLELCRSRVELGAALRRAKRRREARGQLRVGLETAHELGARALVRQAHEELESSGARLGRIELSGPGSLTPSERRVAELAAAGASNREIAQQLFVSLRTVETHLTHAYRKLNISSRRELAAALDTQRP